MSVSPAELIRHWFEEVWNKKNRAAIREMLTPDSVHHGLGSPGQPVTGVEAFEQFHEGFLQAFPDLHVDLQDVIADGDKVAVRYLVTGTQKGDLPGQPATNKKVRFTGGGMCRFDKGKFSEVWNEIDFAKMSYDLAPDTPDVE
jgi:steroid delta-isomerase-like uncharacterized protein